MKKFLLIIMVSTALLLGFSGCYKTCEDPFATNYTLKGACIDLTAAITGTYTGQLQDSAVLVHSAISNITIQVTKVDASHVAVSSGTSSFIGFTATVAASSNGYYLTVVTPQTDNGVAVSGAGAYFQNPADGVYITSGKQLSFNVLAGTIYESFTGTQ